MKEFLTEDHYVDFSAPLIAQKARQLFSQTMSDIEKTKIAYEYVRDEIPHTFDINTEIITAKASDVLNYETGICHAKANLLAALLRSQNIPTGFCFQHITLLADDSLGYCVHVYNAVFIENNWIKLDARGNTKGKNAQFSLKEPILAFINREEYDEFYWPGIYAKPHLDTMKMLENAATIQDIIENIPDDVTQEPDIIE